MKYYNSYEVIKLTNISERLFKERIKRIKDKYEKDFLYKKRGRWNIHQKVIDNGEFNRIRNPKINDSIVKWVDIIKSVKWDFFITITPGISTINDNKELLKYVSKLLKKKYRGKELLLFGTIEETPNTNGKNHHIHFLLQLKDVDTNELKDLFYKDVKEGTDVKRYDYERYNLEGVDYVLKNKDINLGTYKEHYIIDKTRKTKII